MIKLAILTSHPIQYYAPWFRHLSERENLRVKVFYLWDGGVTETLDRGFMQTLKWDIPLLSGYEYEFIPNSSRDPGTHHFNGLKNPSLMDRVSAFDPDAVLMIGYNHRSLATFILRWPRSKAPLVFRGDSHRLVRANGAVARVRRVLISAMFARFSAFLYVGKANYQYYLHHRVPSEKLFFAPHAIDNDRFLENATDARDRAAQWRLELGIPSNNAVVAFVGKFEEKKRPMDLLRAFAQARLCDATLLFVGGGQLETQLKTAAAGQPDIKFAQFQNQSEMPRAYAAADLIVLPSYGSGETWGLAINEAMCMGRAVVVSDHVGCAQDLVRPFENGLVFRAGQVAELASSIEEALSDRGRLKIWGGKGRQIVSEYCYQNSTNGLMQALAHLGLATGEKPVSESPARTRLLPIAQPTSASHAQASKSARRFITDSINTALVTAVWRVRKSALRVLAVTSFRRIDHEKVRRIIIFRTGQLGDTVCALPAINHIRKTFPAAHITLLTDSQIRSSNVTSQEVVKMTGAVDEYWTYDPTRTKDKPYRRNIESKIKSDSFDLVVYLGQACEPLSRIARKLLWWRWSCRLKAANGFVLSHLTGRLEERFVKLYPSTRETDRLLAEILEGSVAIQPARYPDFGILPIDTDAVRLILEKAQGRRLLVIGPGSKMPVKLWGVEKFEELGHRLLAAFGDVFVVVVGGPEDADIGSQLVNSWGEPSFNSAGRASIPESFALISHSHLFVGNDSGAMHLAAAAGVACVAIFTARAPENQWYPYGKDHEVIRHETSCHYCRLEDCIVEGARCIQTITVDEVFSRVCSLLSTGGVSSHRNVAKTHPVGATIR